MRIIGCSNVLVEDVLSQWNTGIGLFAYGETLPSKSSGITLRRVRIIHNGVLGLDLGNLSNVLVEDCETSFNGFLNEWAGKDDPFGPAGAKVNAIHGSTWRRQRAVANFCRGLWWTD